MQIILSAPLASSSLSILSSSEGRIFEIHCVQRTLLRAFYFANTCSSRVREELAFLCPVYASRSRENCVCPVFCPESLVRWVVAVHIAATLPRGGVQLDRPQYHIYFQLLRRGWGHNNYCSVLFVLFFFHLAFKNNLLGLRCVRFHFGAEAHNSKIACYLYNVSCLYFESLEVSHICMYPYFYRKSKYNYYEISLLSGWHIDYYYVLQKKKKKIIIIVNLA